MKYFMMTAMVVVSIAVLTCCAAEDPFEDYGSGSEWNNNDWNNNGATSGGSSSTTGELATFDIAIDCTTAACATASVPVSWPTRQRAGAT